jgi:hypothetical protein
VSWDYIAQKQDEITVTKGDLITVIDKCEEVTDGRIFTSESIQQTDHRISGWWIVRSQCGTRTGLMPRARLLYPDSMLVHPQLGAAASNTGVNPHEHKVSDHISSNTDSPGDEDEIFYMQEKNKGEALAANIKFPEDQLYDTIPGDNVYPSQEQRSDFVQNINRGAEMV